MMSDSPRVLLALPRYRGALHALFPGVAFLAGALKATGCQVAIFDDDVAIYACEKEGMSPEEILRNICAALQPTLVGVYVNTPNYLEALRLSAFLKRHVAAPLVAGGPHATLAGATMLRYHQEFDAVLAGEAEELLPALAWAVYEQPTLVDAFANIERSAQQHGRTLRRVAMPFAAPPNLGSYAKNFFPTQTALGYRQQNDISWMCFLPPELHNIASPDRGALLHPPSPALVHLAHERYRDNFFHTIPIFKGRSVMTGHLSRGCHGNCPFCVPSVLARAPVGAHAHRRLRPPQHIAEELAAAKLLGFSAWYFDEPAFPLAERGEWGTHVRAILATHRVPWGCVARLDEILQADMLAWRDAGLRYLYFGLETPLAALQAGLGKSVDPELAISTSEALQVLGIQCDLSVFFGMPQETEQSVLESIRWLKAKLPRGNVFFSLAAYWPNTPWSQAAGLDPECWEPAYDKQAIAERACWFPEDSVGIDRFFSNATGTYHPTFLTLERAHWIRTRIEASGLRQRFIKYARSLKQGTS